MSELIDTAFMVFLFGGFTALIWLPPLMFFGELINERVIKPLGVRADRKHAQEAERLAELRRQEAKRLAARHPVRGGSGGSDDGDDYRYKSKNQRDHEWYGDHSELNWRDREIGQMYGMDADTYVSNWLESE